MNRVGARFQEPQFAPLESSLLGAEPFALSPLRIVMLRDDEKHSFMMKGNLVPASTQVFSLLSNAYQHFYATCFITDPFRLNKAMSLQVSIFFLKNIFLATFITVGKHAWRSSVLLEATFLVEFVGTKRWGKTPKKRVGKNVNPPQQYRTNQKSETYQDFQWRHGCKP